MRFLLGGAAAAAFALGSMSMAVAAQCTMTGMMPHAMPHCTPMTGPVVWYVASTRAYFLKGSAAWGKGAGTYVCRATAVARGGHPVNLNRGERRPQRHVLGGSHGTPLPMTMTMEPRPLPAASAAPTMRP
jgi:hypothetical protein